MRVMVIVKGTEDSEAGRMPTTDELNAMGHFNSELVEAGILLAADGLTPSRRGKRVRFADSKATVVDGPFAETKELVSGFWLWQVSTMDEALEWASRVPFVDGEVEVRPVFEVEDFGDEFTPELQSREEAMRKAIETQSAD
ncbi:YciI family protein [uncultured Jatrophihabitans sp.]|uniref:YciI family protein n=1 Tax=uncultured Jatrophihabitans sp. TaxID=1610747 RepID=UPI0035CC0A39